jgi:hypothetical protein
MKFKIPTSILYLAIGLNVGIFMLGLTLSQWDLAILSVLNILLCLTPIIIKRDEE